MNIILITDLYGLNNSKSVKKYVNHFEKNGFSTLVYDSCEIAGVDSTSLNTELIHQQFLSFGINQAVDFLLKKELKQTVFLGFSIGGLITYKAVCRGANAKALFCVSSTRIRYETNPGPIPVKAVYGSLDNYLPEQQKLRELQIDYEIFLQLGHNLYDNSSIIPWLVLSFYHFIDQINEGELQNISFETLRISCCRLANMELDNAVKFQVLNDTLRVVGKLKEFSSTDQCFFHENENIIRWVIKNKMDLSVFCNEVHLQDKIN